MSKTTPSLPLSAVIFDRTQKGIPDVPVFASALKQKVNNTSIPTPALSLGAQAILARAGLLDQHSESPVTPPPQQPVIIPSVESTLRADPVRGQTTGFAPSVEPLAAIQPTQQSKPPAFEEVVSKPIQPIHSVVSVTTTAQPTAFFAEDPTLVRWTAGDTSKLHNYLQLLTTGVEQEVEAFVPPVVPMVQIPSLESQLLSIHHRSGVIDRVVIPEIPLTIGDRLEPAIIFLRSHVWKLQRELLAFSNNFPEFRGEIVATLATLWSQLQTYQALIADKTSTTFSTTSRSAWVWSRDTYNRLRGKLTVPTVTISLPSIPAISVTDIKERVIRKTENLKVRRPELTVPTLPSLTSSLSFARTAIQTTLQRILARLSTWISQLKTNLLGIQLESFSHLFSRVLIATSLVMMLLTVGPMVALEANSWKQKIIYSLTPKATEQESAPLPSMTPTPHPEPDKQFQIIIPKLGVNSRIIANVNPAVEKEYSQALQQGVAHAAGTGLPGESNTHNRTIFVFGHSTNGSWNISRYNALFYSLKDLIIGDSITVWFWGKEFDYTVKERKIVEPNDVSFLQPQTEKEQLILQTCWPPGTTWKRLIVVAEPTATN